MVVAKELVSWFVWRYVLHSVDVWMAPLLHALGCSSWDWLWGPTNSTIRLLRWFLSVDHCSRVLEVVRKSFFISVLLLQLDEHVVVKAVLAL